MRRDEYNAWLENRNKAKHTGSNTSTSPIIADNPVNNPEAHNNLCPDFQAMAAVSSLPTLAAAVDSPQALPSTNTTSMPLSVNFVNSIAAVGGLNGVIVHLTKKVRKPRNDKGKPRKKHSVENAGSS